MEDNLQTIIIVIISTFLLFIFPVYMAYEKKDDISYALAMRYTQDFINDVRSKGYLTLDMYEDYKKHLEVTGNTYDIDLQHEYNRYDPITNYYKIENGKYVLTKTTTIEAREEYENLLIQNGLKEESLTIDSTKSEVNEYIDSKYKANGIYKVEDSYKLSSETYTTEHILNVLQGEKKLLLNSVENEINCSDDNEDMINCQYAYIMNVDDTFNVAIKNTNTTLATVMYNMVTAHTLDSNTRIYVNYGGDILSSKWYGNVDYAQMKHDSLSLTTKTEKVIFGEERHYYTKDDLKYYPIEEIFASGNKYSRYIIEFEAKPEDVTELREKGEIDLITYSGYNFAVGTSSNGENKLNVSVGINGISLLVTNESTDTVRKAFALPVRKIKVTDEFDVEQTLDVQTKISDFTDVHFTYNSSTNKIEYSLVGKDSTNNYSSTIALTPKQSDLWKDFNTHIQNPTVQNYKAGTYTDDATDIKYEYTVQVNETMIQVKVEKVSSNNTTILSHPTKIDDYVKIKIEISKTTDGKYIAYLYLDDALVGESIKMDTLPKPNIVGKTIIGDEEEYFSGYIRNVKIYEMGD